MSITSSLHPSREFGDEMTIVNPRFHAFKNADKNPPGMMIRELMANCIEAALKAPLGKRLIKVDTIEHDGYDKLSFYNTGIAMDPNELFAALDISCEVNKQLSIDGNFGEGAKLAASKYNPLGMIYQSCKNGKVSCAWFGEMSNGRYGRLSFMGDERVTNAANSIIDVTNDFTSEELKYDWTRVTLLGKTREQNTAIEPYYGEKSSSGWLAEELYHRFYRIDPSIEIRLYTGHRLPKNSEGYHLFETIEHRRYRECRPKFGAPVQTGVFTKSDTVTLQNGIKLHFIHDEEYGTNHVSSSRTSLQSDVTFSGIVFSQHSLFSEMFSVEKGQAWASKSHKVGIPFCGKIISVLVELPLGYPAEHGAHRRELIDPEKHNEEVRFDNFSDLINDNLPDWLKRLIASKTEIGQATSLDEVKKKLQEFMNKVSLRANASSISANSARDLAPVIVLPKRKNDSRHRDRKPISNHEKTSPATHISPKNTTSTAIHPMFEIKPVFDKEEIENMRLVDRIATYERVGLGTIYINMTYPTIDKIVDEITPLYPKAPQDTLYKMTRELVVSAMITRIGKAVIIALTKQRLQTWSREDVDKSITPEALSILADEYESDLGPIKSVLSARLSKKTVSTVG